MKKINVILTCLCSLFLFTGCYTNILGDSIEPNPNPQLEVKEISINCKLDLDENGVEGLKAVTLVDEKNLNSTEFNILSLFCDKPQLVFITDSEDNIIMMSRDIYSDKDNINIDAETTAIALVTMHPVFMLVEGDMYKELVRWIKSTDSFKSLCEETSQIINKGHTFNNDENSTLIVALSNILEDLCEYENSPVSFTRASVNYDKYPLHITTMANEVTIRTTGLSPQYTGTIRKAFGSFEKDLVVKSRADIGVCDLFSWLTNGHNEFYGEPESVFLPQDGEYFFYLFKDFENTRNRLVSYIIDSFCPILGTLGLKAEIMGDVISSVATNVSAALNGEDVSIETIVQDICNELKYIAITLKDNPVNIGSPTIYKAIGNTFNLYSKIKNSANGTARILYYLDAPNDIVFSLCCYSDKISTCAETDLTIVSGNLQIGEPKEKLLLPLVVHPIVKNEKGELIQCFKKVKFEVKSGNGFISETSKNQSHSSLILGTDNKNGEASVYWTLGDGNPGDVQNVTATVVDEVTGEDISDPVEFTATLKKASDITVRLDWHKLSGNTDIDLHVVDPFEEEIYFAHSRSQSGGWLDRDDVVGPGPEHIYWENAPAGTYKVKVHYYDSKSMAVTTYKVTINVNGESHTYSGSLAYHQEVTVASFTIPATRAADTQGNNIIITPMSDVDNNKVYPEKDKK